MDREIKKALHTRLEQKMKTAIPPWYEDNAYYFTFSDFEKFIKNNFNGKVLIKSFKEKYNFHKIILITVYSRKQFIITTSYSI